MSNPHLVCGWHVVLAALEDGAEKPLEIFIAEGRQDERARRVQALAAPLKIPVRSIARSELDLKTMGLRHQGVMALMPAREFSGEEVLDQPATPDSLILVLDGVQDPHNLGACLRTSEAAGVTAVIIPKDRAATLTPAARKASAGASERLPLVTVTNLARSLKRLRELGYWITGLAGDADESVFDVDFTGPVVLVMGAEGEGLRRLTREGCDRLVHIPMRGRAESLNVSVAAAVCLYEAFRQRNRR
jgi:23S rRNA (guanosine2251-2'-O)-methyltransferase